MIKASWVWGGAGGGARGGEEKRGGGKKSARERCTWDVYTGSPFQAYLPGSLEGLRCINLRETEDHGGVGWSQNLTMKSLKGKRKGEKSGGGSMG